MDNARLIHMANQIGAYFDSEPDRDAARASVADHLARFWAPPMRRQILACLDEAAGAELTPLVAEALAIHRARIQPGAAP